MQCAVEARMVSNGTEVDSADIFEIFQELADIDNSLARDLLAGRVELRGLEAAGDDQVGKGKGNGVQACLMSSHVDSHSESFHDEEGSLETLHSRVDF